MSFELILPFLKPIKHLLETETVSEIMVNPDGSVWVEETGEIQLLSGIRFEEDTLFTGLEVIANRFGKKEDAEIYNQLGIGQERCISSRRYPSKETDIRTQ